MSFRRTLDSAGWDHPNRKTRGSQGPSFELGIGDEGRSIRCRLQGRLQGAGGPLHSPVCPGPAGGTGVHPVLPPPMILTGGT